MNALKLGASKQYAISRDAYIQKSQNNHPATIQAAINTVASIAHFNKDAMRL